MVVAQRGDDLPKFTGDPSVGDMVSHLDATPQQVLRLALFGDFKHVQIGGRLSLPSGTVRHHIRRGLSKLRERLEVQPRAC